MATTNKFINLDVLVYSPISAIVEANNSIATNIIEQVEQVGYKVPNDSYTSNSFTGNEPAIYQN